MKNILFFGSRSAGYETFDYLLYDKGIKLLGVFTIDENDTSMERWAESLKEYAEDVELPVFTGMPTLEDVKSIIGDEKIDIIYSVYYDKIIPKNILELADIAINFHGGILPDYKGSYTNIWTIYNGETKSASTAHIMTEKLDEGDILGEEFVDIDELETGKSLYWKISDATIELFYEIHRQVMSNSLHPISQKKGGTIYRRKLPEDGIINFDAGIKHINKLIRALYFPPHKGACVKTKDGVVELIKLMEGCK